jgi:hypothetical protein
MADNELVLTNSEFRVLVDNLNNMEIRNYTQTKILFGEIQQTNDFLKRFSVHDRYDNYIIIVGKEAFDVCVTRDVIDSIIELMKDETMRENMLKLLRIDPMKKIPKFSYVEVY